MSRVALPVALAVACLPIVTQATLPAAGAATTLCRDAQEKRNAWAPVPQPPGGSGDVVSADDGNCRLYAIGADRSTWLSEDGGSHWLRRGTAPKEATRLITEGLAPDQVVLIPSGVSATSVVPGSGGASGLYLSTDAAHGWVAATGLDGRQVISVDADPQDKSTLYAAVSAPSAGAVSLPGGSPSVYRSTDGGRSWLPLTASTAFAARAVAVDPEDSQVLFAAAAGQTGGLWVSTNGGQVFTNGMTGDASDVSAAALPGGGTEVYLATTDGLLRTRDRGTSSDHFMAGQHLVALAQEAGHAEGLMITTADAVLRSATSGRTQHQVDAGLPSSCQPGALRGDASMPSRFLVRCGSTTFRYRSDGTDLIDIDGGGNPGALGLVPQYKTEPMPELRRYPTAYNGDGQSGAIAFDGELLYYSDYSKRGVIHRQVARTGADAGDIKPDWPRAFSMFMYDSLRHVMYAVDVTGMVVALDLRTNKVAKLFQSQVGFVSASEGDQDLKGWWGSATYDAATDRFIFIYDRDTGLHEYDRTGHLTHECDTGLTSIIVVGTGGLTQVNISMAAVVSTGDGRIYAELEDDATVIRLDRACHVLAAYQHNYFAEARAENYSMACDTVTFGRPVIWMRDAGGSVDRGESGKGYLQAFAVTGGYCALTTTLGVGNAPLVDATASTPVCAVLRRAGTGKPLTNQKVDLLVAERYIGSPLTDSRGRACATYRPDGTEVPPTARNGGSAGRARHRVTAAFLGTIAYRPSSAVSKVAVNGLVTPPIPAPVPPAVQPAPAAPVQAVVVAPAAPPQPPAPPQPQPQPYAQGHPGVQPGAAGAPGGAMAPQDEVEVEAQGADTGVDSFTELAAPPVGIFATGWVLGMVVWQRRRRSRVVGVGA
jgi:hypothetical protein